LYAAHNTTAHAIIYHTGLPDKSNRMKRKSIKQLSIKKQTIVHFSIEVQSRFKAGAGTTKTQFRDCTMPTLCPCDTQPTVQNEVR
jgi:hypothetical protein